MGTITRTYSINDETYEKFIEICKTKNINKSKLIQNCIEKFIFKNSGIKVGDYLLSKVTEEYTNIKTIDENTVSLENGNVLSYSELTFLYEYVDEYVLNVKNAIDNKSHYDYNFKSVENIFDNIEFVDIDNDTYNSLDLRLKKIYGIDKEILTLKVENNKIESMSINAPSDLLSLEEIEKILEEYKIKPNAVRIKISNTFDKKFNLPGEALKIIKQNVYNHISPDVLKIKLETPYIYFIHTFAEDSNLRGYEKIIYLYTDKFKIPKGNIQILSDDMACRHRKLFPSESNTVDMQQAEELKKEYKNLFEKGTPTIMNPLILQRVKDHIYMNINRDKLEIYLEDDIIIFEETTPESFDNVIHKVLDKINPLPEIKIIKMKKEPGIKI